MGLKNKIISTQCLVTDTLCPLDFLPCFKFKRSEFINYHPFMKRKEFSLYNFTHRHTSFRNFPIPQHPYAHRETVRENVQEGSGGEVAPETVGGRQEET